MTRGATEGAELEAAFSWDRGGENRRHGNQKLCTGKHVVAGRLEPLLQIVGCRKLVLQGPELGRQALPSR